MIKASTKALVLAGALALAVAFAVGGAFWAAWSASPEAQHEEGLRLLGKASQSPNSLTSSDMEHLRRMAQSPSARTRMTAFGAIASIKSGPCHGQAIELIEKMKSDPDEGIRQGYIVKAYALKKPGWEEDLRRALEDPDPEVRAKAHRVRSDYAGKSQR